MKKKQIINIIHECIKEALSKTNESSFVPCDCDKEKCATCNPSEKSKKVKFIKASKLDTIVKNKNKSPQDAARAEKLKRFLKQKSKVRGKSITESESEHLTWTRLQISRLKNKYPHADQDEVYVYVISHPNGATIGQLEQDAKKEKWDDQTMRAIYYIMSKLKTSKTSKTADASKKISDWDFQKQSQ